MISLHREALGLARRSPIVGSGLVGGSVTPFLVIFGYSFFPLILVSRGLAHLVVPAFVFREVVGVAFAILSVTALRRYGIAKVYSAAVGVTVLSCFGMAVLDGELAMIVLFASTGMAVSMGTVVCNLQIATGTTLFQRPLGYAVNGVVSRSAGVISPVLLGLAIGYSDSSFFLFVATTATAIGFAYHMVRVRGSPSS